MLNMYVRIIQHTVFNRRVKMSELIISSFGLYYTLRLPCRG